MTLVFLSTHTLAVDDMDRRQEPFRLPAATVIWTAAVVADRIVAVENIIIVIYYCMRIIIILCGTWGALFCMSLWTTIAFAVFCLLLSSVWMDTNDLFFFHAWTVAGCSFLFLLLPAVGFPFLLRSKLYEKSAHHGLSKFKKNIISITPHRSALATTMSSWRLADYNEILVRDGDKSTHAPTMRINESRTENSGCAHHLLGPRRQTLAIEVIQFKNVSSFTKWTHCSKAGIISGIASYHHRSFVSNNDNGLFIHSSSSRKKGDQNDTCRCRWSVAF